MPGCNEESPDWELLYGNSDNFFGAIDTWNVGEMREWLRHQGVTGTDGIGSLVFGNKFRVTEVWSFRYGKRRALVWTITDTDVNAYALSCLSLLQTIKEVDKYATQTD